MDEARMQHRLEACCVILDDTPEQIKRYADLESVRGEPGNIDCCFFARLLRKWVLGELPTHQQNHYRLTVGASGFVRVSKRGLQVAGAWLPASAQQLRAEIDSGGQPSLTVVPAPCRPRLQPQPLPLRRGVMLGLMGLSPCYRTVSRPQPTQAMPTDRLVSLSGLSKLPSA
jgi:hypothetical protein